MTTPPSRGRSVSCRIEESFVILTRNLVNINREWLNRYSVLRAFVLFAAVVSHLKVATCNINQPRRKRRQRIGGNGFVSFWAEGNCKTNDHQNGSTDRYYNWLPFHRSSRRSWRQIDLPRRRTGVVSNRFRCFLLSLRFSRIGSRRLQVIRLF